MRMNGFRRACVAMLSVTLVTLGMQAPASAGIVGTAEAVAASRQDGARALVDATLARADVRAELARMGVDPTAVEGRVAVHEGSTAGDHDVEFVFRMRLLPVDADGPVDLHLERALLEQRDEIGRRFAECLERTGRRPGPAVHLLHVRCRFSLARRILPRTRAAALLSP